jgi:hypothetical protein
VSVERRRTAVVQGIIEELIATGHATVRPGDVCTTLRSKGLPMGTWEVRAEFTRLEAAGFIRIDPATAGWSLVPQSGQARQAGG